MRMLAVVTDKEELTSAEVSTLEALIATLKREYAAAVAASAATTALDEERACWICYARPRSVAFQPCGHSSCDRCIAQQMMHSQQCFFCKAPVLALSQISC